MPALHESETYRGKRLKNITSVQQLLSSYVVAKAIRAIRDERKKTLKEQILVPSIAGDIFQDPRLVDLYLEFAEMANYKHFYMTIMRRILEDLEYYEFESDPSVMTSATADTSHLRERFGPEDFALLARIDLKDHTIRVFRIAMEMAKKKGRSTQYLLPVVGAVLHDFGKARQLRQAVIGRESGPYKAHALVSKLYIEDMLRPMFPDNEETISQLEFMVENHHSNNTRIKKDSNVSFVMEADQAARKEERKLLKSGEVNGAQS